MKNLMLILIVPFLGIGCAEFDPADSTGKVLNSESTAQELRLNNTSWEIPCTNLDGTQTYFKQRLDFFQAGEAIHYQAIFQGFADASCQQKLEEERSERKLIPYEISANQMTGAAEFFSYSLLPLAQSLADQLNQENFCGKTNWTPNVPFVPTNYSVCGIAFRRTVRFELIAEKLHFTWQTQAGESITAIFKPL